MPASTPSKFLPMINGLNVSQRSVDEKYEYLLEILRTLNGVVVGFSGGADSALLAKAAFDVLGERAVAVIAVSASYPRRERSDAVELADEIGIRTLVVETDELADESYASNPENRCYFCKQELFIHLEKVASDLDIDWVAYGANHDDLQDYCPGHAAARERGARAPLLEAGLTKPEIRHLSKTLGLRTWGKPAIACLSSRVPYGTRITKELLERLDSAEDYLRHDLGFSQIRVRHHDSIARIEVGVEEMNRLMDIHLRNAVSDRLKALGYLYVTVDLVGYRTGSLNEAARKLI